MTDHASGTVGMWLEVAPEAVFLCTSRVPLGLRGEQPVELGALPRSLASATGRPDEGRELFREAIVAHREFGNVLFEGVALRSVAELSLEAGALERAAAEVAAAVDRLRRAGDQSALAGALCVQVAALARQGDAAAAAAAHDEAASIARSLAVGPGTQLADALARAHARLETPGRTDPRA